MVEGKKIKYVAIAGNYRTLLIELMMFSKDTCIFLLQEATSGTVAEKMKQNGYNCISYKRLRTSNQFANICAYYRQQLKNLPQIIKVIKEKGYEVFGADHIFSFSNFFINEGINVIEEGFSNYTPKDELFRQNGFGTVKYFVNKMLLFQWKSFSYEPYGYDKRSKSLYLTGMLPVPNELKKKAKLIQIEDLWSDKKNKDINTLFSFDPSVYDGKIVLLTQTLSEDGACTEKQKIKMYREIVRKYDDNIIIKKHPREETNYEISIPGVYVDKGMYPIELLVLNGVNIKKAVTINSTAALSCRKLCDVEFLGTMDYPFLWDRWGKVEKRFFSRDND